jgi:large subunit ribosomal protein L23
MAGIWKKLFQKKEKKEAKKEKETVKKEAETREEKKEVKILKPKSESGSANKILIHPLITEKSAHLGSGGKYSFEVAPGANKKNVAMAVYDLYGEKPLFVNIIRVSGKEVRYGRVRGRTKNWKKAIVTFKPGIKLELYEGV